MIFTPKPVEMYQLIKCSEGTDYHILLDLDGHRPSHGWKESDYDLKVGDYIFIVALLKKEVHVLFRGLDRSLLFNDLDSDYYKRVDECE